MSKPALGRGLGNLLGETRTATAGDTPTAKPAPVQKENSGVGAGLDMLLRAGRPDALSALPAMVAPGVQPVENVPTANPASPTEGAQAQLAAKVVPAEEPFSVPNWLLWSSDILLVALASLMVFKSPAPLHAWEMGVCIAAVIFGCLLGLVAILPKR